MTALHFEPGELPPEAEALRHEVREFLAEAMETVSVEQRARNWTAWNPEFSKKLGAKGWIGMTWPKEYGGSDRSFLERYVLLEELLAAGAPSAFIGSPIGSPARLFCVSGRKSSARRYCRDHSGQKLALALV